jgi:hypothetical protein
MVAMLMALPGAAWAADPAKAIEVARVNYEAENYDQALLSLRTALQLAWNQSPLMVRNQTFVSEEPSGYGMYKSSPDADFDAVEPVGVYCEVLGYTVQESGGNFKISLGADFEVLDAEERVLGGQDDFGTYQVDAKTFITEYSIYFTFNLRGLPQGDYTLRVTVKDRLSSKTTQFDLPFSING